MKLIDRTLKMFGLRRASNMTSYRGAEVSRLFWDWVVAPTKADDEIRNDMARLRARGRELGRNNAIAKYYLDLVASNMVGPDGMRLRALVRDSAGELRGPVNKTIENAWADFWADPWLDGRTTGLLGEYVMAKQLAMDGELFVRIVPGIGKHGLKIMMVDPDLVDHTYHGITLPNGNELRLGVEVDKTGRPVAYHLWKDYPTAGYGVSRERVPAAQIIHLFDPQRANQTRGVTWFAPVMVALRMTEGLYEAILILNRVAASKMGFFVHKNPEDFNPDAFKNMQPVDASPGTAMALPPGVEFQGWDTGQPGDNFESFNKVLERYIASGLRVSYVSLFGNVSDTTYSGGRTGVIQERDNWRMLHRLYKDGFRRPLHNLWLEHATLSGELRLPSYQWQQFTAAEFRARTWPWVDPLKDLRAAEIAIKNGLGCRTDYADERGMDVNELFEKLGKERELAAKYGIDITGDQVVEPALPVMPAPSASSLPIVYNLTEKGAPR